MGFVGVRTQVWISFDLGEGGQAVCLGNASWAGCPTPLSHPGWAQVGWGDIREGFSPVIGKEEPFLASDTSFPQQFPAPSPPPWPLDTLGPGLGWPGESPEAGAFSVGRGLSLGVSIPSSLETADEALL